MDRGNIGRWLFFAAAAFLIMTFLPNLFGGGSSERQPLQAEGDRLPVAATRPPARSCDLYGPGFHAQVTTQGGGIRKFELLDSKYRREGKPIDLATTPDLELRRPLRFHFRNPAAKVADDASQLALDSLDFTIEKSDAKRCELVYRDDRTLVRKVVRTTARPYELVADVTLQNLADRPLSHTLSVYTDVWRREEETKSSMFGASPLMTHVECVANDGTTKRLMPPDFEPDDFQNVEHFPRNNRSLGDWFQAPGTPGVAAVSNAYFSQAIVPQKGPAAVCQMQIEDRWDSRHYSSKGADPNGGALYRSRLAYPTKQLAPNETVEYSVLSYIGPKERKILAAAGGGNRSLIELIDLGFFSAIAKILVAFLLKVHSVIPNWGVAIIVLTVTARTLLFPLAIPGIKGMIKMRELKPEIDALNEKFKDDPQAKGLAQMELWRKHNVNPLKGCLPQLASMPVWFALYTTLQTAVELYNIPFLWFPDLSARDPYYILPFIIGATSFFQQKLMPLQGDPAQQKMMLYFMPAMFTVFMLFLPAGLGVYMFTNGVLGILQQQAVEWHVRRSIRPGGGPGSGDIKVKVIEDSDAQASAKKGKAPKKGSASPSGGGRGGDGRLLGEGEA